MATPRTYNVGGRVYSAADIQRIRAVNARRQLEPVSTREPAASALTASPLSESNTAA
jgi:hypothetical protein